MAVNKNALIRYKTIDKCLQNRFRKWTLEDLIDECSEALYEYEGIDKGVSRRTVQGDIQIMRSDKLGYNAPIIVVDKRYYTYEDPDYSITNIPISDQDLNKLTEAVEFLKQFKGFSHFRELDAMVQKLEDHVHSQQTDQLPVIDFEKNENLKGLEYLDELYQSIINYRPILITYQSFKARQANSFNFHPYLLKEFRNRWFVIGRKKKDAPLMNLALDRIISIEQSNVKFVHNLDFDPKTYFENAIGVSVSPTMPAEKVKLFITHKHAPYVITKPLHASQKVIDKDYYGVTVSLDVQHNFELEKEILSYGESMRVIQPEKLKRNIEQRLQWAQDNYRTVLSSKNIEKSSKQLEHRGFALMNNVYTNREINKMAALLNNYFKEKELKKPYAVRALLKEIPDLKKFLFNKNLLEIVGNIDSKAKLVKAIYFNKTEEDNWYVTMHQDVPINVKKKVKTDGYSGWTNKDGIISVRPPEEINQNIFAIRIHLDPAHEENGALKVIPGSHKKQLSTEEIKMISENSIPVLCEVETGGIHLMKPLILHASAKSKKQKKRRVVHLEFASAKLPKELKWAEAEKLSELN